MESSHNKFNEERRMSGILKSQSQKHQSSTGHVGFDKVVVKEVDVQNEADVEGEAGQDDIQMQDSTGSNVAFEDVKQEDEGVEGEGTQIEMSIQEAELQRQQSGDDEERRRHEEFLKKRKEFNKGEVNSKALFQKVPSDDEDEDQ
ncbi:UNKNOWN [Stylonychia lemnae]|uniref:Uncharacterized protein n=1 Tax=Stylonychia lemnae TaxID=5949 RepID=A0A077ZZ89_STYLE|nr:UNKNOWN [Stylonychia lemnae]|eukprot:CDW75245.1 UNKNOWN [Stylonychia lemnae]